MINRLILDIYEAALEPEGWNSLFTRLSQQLDGAAVYLGHSRMDCFGTGEFWTVGVDPREWDRFEEPEQSAQTNCTLSKLLSTEGQVVDRRVIIPDAEVGRDQLSRVFLAEQGLFHAAISVVQRDDQYASTFWVGSDYAHPVESGSMDLVRALAPHIGQAMSIHRALGRQAHEVIAFQAALEALDRGAVLLDKSLRLHYANSVAHGILESDQGLTLRNGRLQARKPGVQRALETYARRLTDPSGDLKGGTMVVPHPTGDPRWRLTVAPAIGTSLHSFACAASIVVFIDDLSRVADEPTHEVLMSELGLTPAEARVAALSARALRPNDIAIALQVSINTVKTHLKAVHGRLGVDTQAQLVRKVLTQRCH